MKNAEKRKVNIFELEYFRSLVRMSCRGRVRNEEVRRRAGIESTDPVCIGSVLF